eukprot:3131089-Amphidinium_carterae.1
MTVSAMSCEAFDYYSPNSILDFSDTGELMWVLGLHVLNGMHPKTHRVTKSESTCPDAAARAAHLVGGKP